MSFSSAPKTPDPYATAAAQEQANVQAAQTQAKMNAPLGNVTNAYGSNQVLTDANGQPIGQVSTLSAPLQGLLTGQEGLGTGIQGAANGLLGSLPSSINVPTTNTVGQAAFDQMKTWLEPQFDRQTQATMTMLGNRGAPVGGDEWNNTMKPLQETQAQAWNSLAGQAQLAGANEQNMLAQQALQQYLAPYSGLSTLLSSNPTAGLLGQAPGAYSLQPSTVGAAPVNQDVYQSYNNNLAAYNQNQQNIMNGVLGGAALLTAPISGGTSLFGKALSYSDKNLKEDRHPAEPEHILLELGKIPVDHYRYKDEAQTALGVPEHRTGAMAQDWHAVFPESGGGEHMIDIADLAGKLLAAVQGLEQRTHHLAPSEKLSSKKAKPATEEIDKEAIAKTIGRRLGNPDQERSTRIPL